MKKLLITISLVIPLALSALPAFAALSTTPASSTNFNDLQINVSGLDDWRVILVGPNGLVIGDTETTNGYPFPGTDGTYSPSQLGFTPAGVGIYTIISAEQSENGYGSCTPGNTLANCLYMIFEGTNYKHISTFELLAPPPWVAVHAGDFGFPSSTMVDLLASVSNVVGDMGLLGVIIIAMAIPLFFWFVKEIIAIDHKRK
jgi:hypothetical protein